MVTLGDVSYCSEMFTSREILNGYLLRLFGANVTKQNARAMIQAIDKRLKITEDHGGAGEICWWNTIRFNTTAGNPVKKILLKLNLSDHRLFKDGGGVNESQERRSIESFSRQPFKKGMSMSVQKSQVHKMAKFQDGKEIVLG
ncbi:hypothetical protein Tco_0483774 [Tanacetum coccineum]